jgi:hypothetical protein
MIIFVSYYAKHKVDQGDCEAKTIRDWCLFQRGL